MAALWVQVPMPHPAKQVSQSFGSFFFQTAQLDGLVSVYEGICVSSWVFIGVGVSWCVMCFL